VPLQTAGRNQYFSLFMDWGGTVMRFHELGAAHGSRPAFLLLSRLRGWTGSCPAWTRVERYGCFVFGALARRPAQGPYFLGAIRLADWSRSSGTRLVERQEEVRALTLVDTYLPAPKNGQSLVRKVLRALDRTKLAYLKKRIDSLWAWH